MSQPPKSPRLPTPTSADNPSYLGMFSDPYTATFCDPSEALAELQAVVKNVEEIVSGSRRRKSIKTMLTNSLRRRKKKARTQSCSEHFTAHLQSDEENLVDLVRSASLDDNPTVETSYHSNPTSPSYYNVPFVLDRPPRPPTRTHYSSNTRSIGLNHNLSLQENLTPRSPSETFLRKSNASNMKSSRILHRRCHKLELNFRVPEDCPDIFIIKSDGCTKSETCSHFFATKLGAQDANLKINIESAQEVAGSALLCEKLFHARAQILVLGGSLLNWIYDHPDLLFGNLLNPDKLLTLLFGISPTDILPEHRSSFIHFQDWKLLRIVDDNFLCLEQKVTEEIQSILGRMKLKRNSDLDKIQFFPQSVSILRRDLLVILPDGLLADDLDFIDFVTSDKAKVRARNSSDFSVKNRGCLKMKIPSEFFESRLNSLAIEFGFRSNVTVAKKLQVQTWRDDLVSDLQSVANTDSTSAVDLKLALGCSDEKLSWICRQILNREQNSDLITKLGQAVKTSSEPFPRLQGTLEELSSTVSSLPPIPAKRIQRCTQNCNTHYYDVPRNLQMHEDNHCTKGTRSLDSSATYDLFYHKGCRDQNCDISAQTLRNNDECHDKGDLKSSQANCVKQDSVKDEDTQAGNFKANSIVAPYIPMKSSTLSKSTASSCKESSRMRSSSTSQINLMKDFLVAMNTSLKPESRQEIIEKHFNDSKNENENSEDDENQQNEGKSFQEFPDLFGFTPPVSTEAGDVKHSYPIDYGNAEINLFENCQADLIDLQEKYKNEILSLAEVEDRFEQWKCRPELNVCKDQRMQEVEAMRGEWVRLQTLAEQKKRKESHFMSLMRGWMRSSKKSTSNSNSSEANTLDFSLPQKSELNMNKAQSTPTMPSDYFMMSHEI